MLQSAHEHRQTGRVDEGDLGHVDLDDPSGVDVERSTELLTEKGDGGDVDYGRGPNDRRGQDAPRVDSAIPNDIRAQSLRRDLKFPKLDGAECRWRAPPIARSLPPGTCRGAAGLRALDAVVHLAQLGARKPRRRLP